MTTLQAFLVGTVVGFAIGALLMMKICGWAGHNRVVEKIIEGNQQPTWVVGGEQEKKPDA
jgi:hypothetical protein